MLAQQLGVSRIGLVAHIQRRPVLEPPFDELRYRFPARICVSSGSDAGHDPRQFLLGVGLGALDGLVARLTLAIGGADVVLEPPRPLAAPCEVSLTHDLSSSGAGAMSSGAMKPLAGGGVGCPGGSQMVPCGLWIRR